MKSHQMFCSRRRINLYTLNVTAHLMYNNHYQSSNCFSLDVIRHPCCIRVVVVLFLDLCTMLLLLPAADAIVFRPFIFS